MGEDVIIRSDPRDLAELRVYFADAFICRAICPELAGETIALKDIILPGMATAVSCGRRWQSARRQLRHCWGCDADPTHRQSFPKPKRHRARRHHIGRA